MVKNVSSYKLGVQISFLSGVMFFGWIVTKRRFHAFSQVSDK